MTDSVNPIIASTALLAPQMPGIYNRNMIYDPTWDDPSYNMYFGQRIVPAPTSLVRDSDNTPLWVLSTDPVTHVPTYTTVQESVDNDNNISLLNYGNTVFRLYVDYRGLPYPITPDAKCIFIGKSPRFYTLSRYPGTPRETIISQYFDATGKLVSQMVPMVAQTAENHSWYLPRCHTSVTLEDNEEIEVKVFSEDGSQVFSAMMFTKESAVINENIVYSPTVVGMTVSALQQLANGTFYLYEKQDFGSLGFTATLVYDDGSTSIVPIDDNKCKLYGQSDFISSFSGLVQHLTVKYFSSKGEAISPAVADKTGTMISITVPVTVVPNSLGTTNKILAIPIYNAALARYMMHYWLYFADGRSHIDVTAYAAISIGALVTDSSHFGVSQTYAVSFDMSKIDPVHYPTSTHYQQTIVVTFGPPNGLVKWTLKDAMTSPNILGQDTVIARRPSIRYDAGRNQYFIPSQVFTNKAAFINSFYIQASPPYDPQVALIPQQPTHFIVRDLLSGSMVTAAPISVDEYARAFTVINDTTGKYVGSCLVVEFINVINSSTTNILFGVGVDVIKGAYIGV